jgi:hypothetical protein
MGPFTAAIRFDSRIGAAPRFFYGPKDKPMAREDD